MANYPQTWDIRKPDELLGQTWQELFLDPESVFMTPSGVFKSCDNRKEYIFLDDVKNSVSKIRQSGLSNKTKDELFIENIENGKIKAYSIMMFSIGDFDKKDLPEIVDSLKRVYQATGFRPLKGFWLEDYVDEETGDVVTIGRGEVEFVKCSDKSYQVLRSTLSENDITKVVTHHFL